MRTEDAQTIIVITVRIVNLSNMKNKYTSTYHEFNEAVRNAIRTLVAQMDYGLNREFTEKVADEAHKKIITEYLRIFEVGGR
jgi:hypothetical protein